MSTSVYIFCPRCATENGVEQAYCRQCGQGLSGIQWVLEGNIAESQKRLDAAEKWIKAGNSTLIAFISIAVTIAILGVAIGNSTLSTIAMVNVLGGALIGFPLLFVGNAKLIKGKRLVSQADVSNRPAIAGTSRKQLVTPQTSELPTTANHSSITEHTTLHLAKSDPARRK
jgi:hypothetical protein